MNGVDELIQKKNEYRRLREKLNYIIIYLDRISDNLLYSSKNFSSLYNIDGRNIGNEKLVAVRTNFQNTADYLRRNVLPTIDYNISQINKLM